ncbi:hypothetical protein Pmani_026890 [Petrolisthes manimaculis]|uniref:Uncharacterized protein n=1 Tax=Petrolisthes manimaculis TaxID=1843537 RepID=A0AAE1TZP1_9EUCA|nr:hypothetical protein Pmani_026890 [Petrolisthes manimaculis]
MSSTVQLDITHLTLPPINLTADDVQAKFVTFKGSFQQEVKKIHNTPRCLQPKTYHCSLFECFGYTDRHIRELQAIIMKLTDLCVAVAEEGGGGGCVVTFSRLEDHTYQYHSYEAGRNHGMDILK